MEQAAKCFFRDQLRSARAAALADAEGFLAVLRAIEMVGQQLDRKASGIGGFKTMLSALASNSPLATDLPTDWPSCHTEFGALYDELKQARNDAVHQGAYARTITDHAVELSMVLEDALMIDASAVSQFMVRNVVEAKLWQPVSYVRQQMLSRAFSYLPIWHSDAWRLVPEFSIAKLLRTAASPSARRRRLSALISETVADGNLELLDACTVHPDLSVVDALMSIREHPVLVVDRKDKDILVGLLTASDVL